MKAAVLVFPGINRERDMARTLRLISGDEPAMVWHTETALPAGTDLVVIPGGFSYGDYLRCGAIAARSPIMDAVRAHATKGALTLGVCNGFQILCEAGLLPGVLMRNARLRFICRDVYLRVEHSDSPFTRGYNAGQVIRVPTAHGEGNYIADAETIDRLEKEGRVLFRYSSPEGTLDEAFNVNGATNAIAGIINERGNVLGMMPHPENHVEASIGVDRRARAVRRAGRGIGQGGMSDLGALRNEPKITPELVAEHGLKPDEYKRLLELIGRTPTLTELGIFSAMWNEHCSYKSSKVHLRTLPTKGPHVIQGPGENAGVIDIGDGLACVFKMESHNHPSYIEPYQGAATGVGGILRDVFTMGARPIACLNALSFGAPGNPKTRHLVSGVVAGIGGYGNSFRRADGRRLGALPFAL